jgi:hypothetical protein
MADFKIKGPTFSLSTAFISRLNTYSWSGVTYFSSNIHPPASGREAEQSVKVIHNDE